jgi:hypothetical protein
MIKQTRADFLKTMALAGCCSLQLAKANTWLNPNKKKGSKYKKDYPYTVQYWATLKKGANAYIAYIRVDNPKTGQSYELARLCNKKTDLNEIHKHFDCAIKKALKAGHFKLEHIS